MNLDPACKERCQYAVDCGLPRCACVKACVYFIGYGVREHTDGADCWCQPEVYSVDPVTGVRILVHRDVQ